MIYRFNKERWYDNIYYNTHKILDDEGADPILKAAYQMDLDIATDEYDNPDSIMNDLHGMVAKPTKTKGVYEIYYDKEKPYLVVEDWCDIEGD